MVRLSPPRNSPQGGGGGGSPTSSPKSTTTSNEAMPFRLLRHLFAAGLIFLAGAHVNHIDQTLRRMMMTLNTDFAISWAGGEDGDDDAKNTTTLQQDHQLAFDQSYGFFDDMPESDWLIHQKWARHQPNHRYGFDPQRHYLNPALWYYNNYNPIFNCPHSKRVWGIGDGPKWVCDPHRLVRQAQRRKEEGQPGPHCLIYSIGSNGNYEFEDGMYGQVGDICEIHIFDFSNNYSRPVNQAKNMHFHQWGLQGTQQDRITNRGEFVNFPQILQRLGHENRTIDIFKIDCEGCEWDTYQDWIHHDLRQVLIETHQLPENRTLGFHYFDSFKNNSLLMFSKEVNGFGQGKYYEFSYVKMRPDFLYPPPPPPAAATEQPVSETSQ